VARSRLSQLDFNYTPKVKGLVTSLLALKPEDHRKCMALGRQQAIKGCRGGRTRRQNLLERGGIRKRATLILLLDKVCTFKISSEVRAVALSTPGH